MSSFICSSNIFNEQVGDQVATDAEATVSADWASMREAFMSMLDG